MSGIPSIWTWHGLAVVTLDVGGTLIRHGAFHATPFSRGMRADQNERLVAAITRPASEPPTLVGADWNTECADRILVGQRWDLYEPADPYAGVDWFADLIYQCQWDYDEQGRRRHWADRLRDVLWAGGLHDVAALTGADWHATTGHHPHDVYGAHGVRRRIDASALPSRSTPRCAHTRCLTPRRAASDHLPVTVEYLPRICRRCCRRWSRAGAEYAARPGRIPGHLHLLSVLLTRCLGLVPLLSGVVVEVSGRPL